MKIPLELTSSQVLSNYTPCAQDLERIQLRDGCFTMSGDGIFHTIQGEGTLLGQPATFIRLHFCNLACTWCDAWYTWRNDREEYYKEPFNIRVEDLRSHILRAQEIKGLKNIVPHIVFTGGEPMIQAPCIEQFLKLNPDLSAEIETNGTLMPSPYLLETVQWNCSPKTSNSGNPQIRAKKVDVLLALAERNTHFKFVCSTPDDIEEILRDYAFLPREQLLIMPEGITKEQNAAVYQKINATILKHGLKTSPRLQNIMYDCASRRV